MGLENRGLDKGREQEPKSERLGYTEAVAKAEQLWYAGGDIENAMTIDVPKGEASAEEVKQRAYKWRDDFLNFVNKERPSTRPDDFLKEKVSYKDAEKLTWPETSMNNIFIKFMAMQRSLDEGKRN
jgi:hypothetical protein